MKRESPISNDLFPALEGEEGGFFPGHRRTENAIRESEERCRRIIETAQEGIWFLDAQKRTLFVNQHMADILGFTPAEMKGRTLGDFVEPEAEEEARRWFGEPEGGKAAPHNLRLRRKDGSAVWTVLTASPLYDEKGVLRGALGMFTDVTHCKTLEDQLIQAQKMEAVGRLAGGLAHDFNNMLTAIMGYTELMLAILPGNHQAHHHAEEIRKATAKAVSLTRQLLTFSRKQPLQSKVMDLNGVVTEMERILLRLIGENIQLAPSLEARPALVRAAPGQIEQLVMNMAINARDAMARGGVLTLQTRNAEVDAAEAAHSVGLKPGPYLVLSIADTGAGMSAEVQAHLFEPFFTTKPRGQGTGLGLAICYAIVHQIGGHIRVQSQPGHGARFDVFLPCAAETAPDQEVGEKKPAAPARGSETILVVEDDESVRALAAMVLRDQGYTVLEAGNGEEALRLSARETGEDIQLVVADIVMPQLGGGELAARLRERFPSLKVLFCSGYSDEPVIRVGRSSGAGSAFLQKPYSPQALVRTVRDLLDRKTPP